MTTDPRITQLRGTTRLAHEQVLLLSRAVRAAEQARQAIADGAPADMYAQDLRDGAAAREVLVEANSGLVVTTARPYAGRGVPMEDLIQEGMAGLVKAVDRFDPDRGYRFSTHAVPWIKQGVINAVNTSRVVRRPVLVENTLRKIHAVRAALLAETGTEPTVEQVAARADVEARLVRRCLSADAPEASLDAAYGDGPALGEALPSATARDAMTGVERRADLRVLDAAVGSALDALSPLERQVLVARFGLGGADRLSLADAAERIGVDRSVVRVAEVRALAVLRKNPAVLTALAAASPTAA